MNLETIPLIFVNTSTLYTSEGNKFKSKIKVLLELKQLPQGIMSLKDYKLKQKNSIIEQEKLVCYCNISFLFISCTRNFFNFCKIKILQIQM